MGIHGFSRGVLAFATAGLAISLSASAAQQPATPPAAAPAPPPEVGIPITNKTVQSSCGGCHRSDDKGQMSRISFQRNTPEGWQDTIKRMVALNGLKLEPAAGREVVKYLSDNLGLAPEEAKPVAYEVERRVVDETYTASPDLQGVCNACHSLGRVRSQRRTRTEWELLISMHRGWYPLVDRQVYRRMGPAPRDRGPDGRQPDTRHPSEKAVDHLSQAFPLQTPEWASWSATKRSPRIDGTWALSGYEVGKGPVYGRVVIAPVPNAPDEFTTETTFTYAKTGEQVKRTGRSMIYTGFQWRGRSTAGAAANAPVYREVMFVDRDWRGIEGRWFTGGYDEIGMDVQLRRSGADMTLLGVDRAGLRKGAAAQTVKIFALNAPASVQASDLDFGPGVSVTGATVAGNVITATVNVADAAIVGPRDIVISGAVKPGALVVYDKVDHIRVTPEWNLARTGGVNYPKMYAQFDAWGYMNGPDKKPNTPDDVKIDVVDATWSMEEYTATLDDDDIKFVGAIDPKSGAFTPNIEGPNEQRSGQRNNIGDVWVVATYTEGGSPLRGRAHLLVSPPVYMRFDSSVISR